MIGRCKEGQRSEGEEEEREKRRRRRRRRSYEFGFFDEGFDFPPRRRACLERGIWQIKR